MTDTPPPAWPSEDDVERVARAIYRENHEIDESPNIRWRLCTEEAVEHYLRQARAALEAMRPTLAASETAALERAAQVILAWKQIIMLRHELADAIRALKPTTGRVG